MRGGSHRSPKLTLLLPAVYVLVLMTTLPASAGLGASTDSIRDDQLSMRARITIIPARDCTVHELSSPLGMVVREYVSSNGTVFAISWHGPFAPDMHRMLAKRFEMYSLELKKRNTRTVGHSELNIRTPFLVMESVGHMRAYAGRAYDPSLLPAGINSDEIR